MGKRMEACAARLREADAETLWADIQRMAAGLPWQDDPDPVNAFSNSMLANAIIKIAEVENWTVLRTALALAYAHIMLSSDHQKDLKELAALQTRPIVMNRHCANCNCPDKITRWEDQ